MISPDLNMKPSWLDKIILALIILLLLHIAYLTMCHGAVSKSVSITLTVKVEGNGTPPFSLEIDDKWIKLDGAVKDRIYTIMISYDLEHWTPYHTWNTYKFHPNPNSNAYKVKTPVQSIDRLFMKVQCITKP